MASYLEKYQQLEKTLDDFKSSLCSSNDSLKKLLASLQTEHRITEARVQGLEREYTAMQESLKHLLLQA